jgi:hypothetical protein
MTTELRVFGYTVDNRVDRKEASIVRMIFFMYVVCGLPHERIAFHLNHLKIACLGYEWTALLVYELLTNPAYIGHGLPDILQDDEAWEIAQQSTALARSTPASIPPMP